ncbi:uncharacterized protein E6C27_scaffold60G002890 [Cucumis melo var. makuwa]|uniref:DUF659 domain-containing protein n=1 Tax=Cucumis melo var. makuwa TaxID=1194695 RepID=A0A5A7UC95_CUCMM|nr:uncharacterized protein E6C27_scaffold60G002890 [Cucumis melo var. makuwa]
MREHTVQRIARWFYDAGVPLNACTYDSFTPMIESIGQFGPELKPPTYHELRVPCLKKELEATNELMRSHKAEWAKVGCTVMADGALKRRYNLRDIVDLISLRDIDDSNEWLIGRLDDDSGEEDELVFDDDTLNPKPYTLTWGDVSRAAGEKEPTFYSRARASEATNVSCSSSSTTQPTPKQINLDDSDQEEEDIDGYKSNKGVNEDEDQFIDDEFDF